MDDLRIGVELRKATSSTASVEFPLTPRENILEEIRYFILFKLDMIQKL